MIPDVKKGLLETTATLGYAALHRFAAEFRCAQVTLVNQFFLVFYVVVKGGIRQAELA